MQRLAMPMLVQLPAATRVSVSSLLAQRPRARPRSRVWALIGVVCAVVAAPPGNAQAYTQDPGSYERGPNAREASRSDEGEGVPGPWGAPFDPTQARFSLAISALVATPYGSTGLSLDQWQPGMLIGLHFGVGRIPLTLGVEGWALFGVARPDRVDLVQGVVAPADRYAKVLCMNASLRLQLPFWRVRPYVEGLAGIQDTNVQYSGVLVSSRADWNHGHLLTGGFGWGAGVDLYFSQGAGLTLGIRSQYAHPTRRTRSIEVDQMNVAVSNEIATNLLSFVIGFTSRY
ncbi:MAG: hypothetical protein RL701_6748 [Pseudomonadota bacterium]